MSNISKRRREGSRTKIKAMADHKEFLKRITKTLYYGHLPTLPCLSLPVTEISCEQWSCGGGLRRLGVGGAARVARGACVSPCALVLALLYLERLRRHNPRYLLRTAPQDLFLVSLMVGNKFLQDDGEEEEVVGAEWAASGDLRPDQLNALELDFLDAIEWKVYVSSCSFEAGLRWLERRVALRQARARGFFTYGDLAAACDAAELARALRAACFALGAALAALATLLTSALVLSHALAALRLLHDLSDLSDVAAVADVAALRNLETMPTLPNNATVELVIDALNDSERISWCAAWRHAPVPAPATLFTAEWSALRRWLGRAAEYAERARASLVRAHTCRPPRPPRAPHRLTMRQLSALLVTVSDR